MGGYLHYLSLRERGEDTHVPDCLLQWVGLILLQLFVSAGQNVKEGDKLMVVVAMKMEVVVKAPTSGQVEEILVAEGSKVVEGALLLKLA